MLGGCPTTLAPMHVGPDGATQFVELGTGDTTFVPLVDGGTIELVHGPQGGYHLPVTSRIFGLDPDGRLVHYVAETPDGVVLAEASLALMTRRLVPDEGGWLRLGDRIVLPISGPADVVGHSVVVRLSLEESAFLDGGSLEAGVAHAVLATTRHEVTIVDDVP